MAAAAAVALRVPVGLAERAATEVFLLAQAAAVAVVPVEVPVAPDRMHLVMVMVRMVEKGLEGRLEDRAMAALALEGPMDQAVPAAVLVLTAVLAATA